jgi:hypothetical protein
MTDCIYHCMVVKMYVQMYDCMAARLHMTVQHVAFVLLARTQCMQWERHTQVGHTMCA